MCACCWRHTLTASGSVSPQQVLDELSAAGVKAQASDPAYHYTHEKAMIVDGATVFIMTCNLTRSGLGGSSSTANREYGIIDTNSADVQGVEAHLHGRLEPYRLSKSATPIWWSARSMRGRNSPR